MLYVLPMAARTPFCRLGRADFEQPTLVVARALLGAFVWNARARRVGMITEVEAYKGPHDLACHARKGRRTARVEPLYGPGGTVYVYLVYGMHWLLNFSTAGRGKPEGVLVRALLAEDGTLVDGPGRVTRHLAIDKRFDGVDAITSAQLWLEDRGVRVPPSRVRRGPRVGIDFAGPYWAARPWRFWIEEPRTLVALESSATPRSTVRADARPSNRGGRSDKE
jgi:DNA-3-methyladenine glycosylase